MWGSDTYDNGVKTNLARIHAYQSKFLCIVTDAPFYISNVILNKNKKIQLFKPH